MCVLSGNKNGAGEGKRSKTTPHLCFNSTPIDANGPPHARFHLTESRHTFFARALPISLIGPVPLQMLRVLLRLGGSPGIDRVASSAVMWRVHQSTVARCLFSVTGPSPVAHALALHLMLQPHRDWLPRPQRNAATICCSTRACLPVGRAR